MYVHVGVVNGRIRYTELVRVYLCGTQNSKMVLVKIMSPPLNAIIIVRLLSTTWLMALSVFIVRVFLAGLFWLSLPYCTTTILSMMFLLPLFVPSTVSMGGSACVDISIRS